MRPEGPRYHQPGIWPDEAWKGGGAMPQSLSRIMIHLIFSTKNRGPVLAPEIRAELHPYLAAGLQENECPSLQVGGTEDHVHLLFGLSRTWTVAQVVEEVKVSSSKWIKTKGPGFADFHWQAGYGAFSVIQSNAAAVVRYIQNQVEHHRKTTFREEYQNFLRRHRVVYDERYVWD
jgi:putative transposase